MSTVDLSNKIAIVTGANSGIGKETAQALATMGATVILACRDALSAERARLSIIKHSHNSNVEVLQLDLAKLASVRRFVAEFQQQYGQLDILISNAGLFPLSKQMTNDGFEMQFGVNHLGHFLLGNLLLPSMRKAEHARLIVVASMVHHIGKIDFASFRGETRYGPAKAYGQSKLANVLYAREFSRRYSKEGITAYALHPGMVGTNIAGRSLIRRTIYKLLGGIMSPARGAKTSIYLATEPSIEEHSGSYYDEFQKIKPGSKLSNDQELAAKLWKTSEQLVSIG